MSATCHQPRKLYQGSREQWRSKLLLLNEISDIDVERALFCEITGLLYFLTINYDKEEEAEPCQRRHASRMDMQTRWCGCHSTMHGWNGRTRPQHFMVWDDGRFFFDVIDSSTSTVRGLRGVMSHLREPVNIPTPGSTPRTAHDWILRLVLGKQLKLPEKITESTIRSGLA